MSGTKKRTSPLHRAWRPAEAARILRARRAILITYLRECLRVEDWHGVQDAASDIREVDARLKQLGAKL